MLYPSTQPSVLVISLESSLQTILYCMITLIVLGLQNVTVEYQLANKSSSREIF